MFILAGWSLLEVDNITTIDYYLQTSCQTEQFKSMIVSRLRHYVSEHQTRRDTHLLSLKNVYNVQIYRYIKLSPFRLRRRRARPRSTTDVPEYRFLVLDVYAISPLYASLELIRRDKSLHNKDFNNLRLAQKRYKALHYHHIQFAVVCQEGSEVYLDKSPLFRSAIEKSATDGYRKLLPRKQGP